MGDKVVVIDPLEIGVVADPLIDEVTADTTGSKVKKTAGLNQQFFLHTDIVPNSLAALGFPGGADRRAFVTHIISRSGVVK